MQATCACKECACCWPRTDSIISNSSNSSCVRPAPNVEIAENGRIAVEKASGGAFDVILMDINMPVMDGYEATRLFAKPGYDRPILALTANAMPEDSTRCRDAGCDDYLSKPIDRPRMLQMIDHYARQELAAVRDAEAP